MSRLGTGERDVLLAVLHLRGEGYAISVADEIERRTGRAPSLGSIYPTLDRLQRKGFISSKMGEATPERGGKRKRHYRIEAPGVRALKESRASDKSMWAGVPAGVRAVVPEGAPA
jgi:PadR family transcriptional regulator, regulatory protein PadR